jgi:hypothetical protein
VALTVAVSVIVVLFAVPEATV